MYSHIVFYLLADNFSFYLYISALDKGIISNLNLLCIQKLTRKYILIYSYKKLFFLVYSSQ